MAEVLGRLCYFIFVHLAVPLLKSHFYATEALWNVNGGKEVLYIYIYIVEIFVLQVLGPPSWTRFWMGEEM